MAKVLAEEALRKARDLYHSLDEQVQLQALRRATLDARPLTCSLIVC